MSVIALIGCSDSQYQAEYGEDEYTEDGYTEEINTEYEGENSDVMKAVIEEYATVMNNMYGNYEVDERVYIGDGWMTTVASPNVTVNLFDNDYGITQIWVVFETGDYYSETEGVTAMMIAYDSFFGNNQAVVDVLSAYKSYGDLTCTTGDGISWEVFNGGGSLNMVASY